VVAGTATAVSNRVSRRQANRWAAQEQQPTYAQQQYAPPPQQYYEPAPPPPPQQATVVEAPMDTVSQLKELALLRSQGILTDAEFDAQKAKILAS
jgi:hypothetical protein